MAAWSANSLGNVLVLNFSSDQYLGIICVVTKIVSSYLLLGLITVVFLVSKINLLFGRLNKLESLVGK